MLTSACFVICMVMNSFTGKFLMLIGIGMFVVGVIIYFFGDKLGWIGKLPGDILVERDNFRIYIPFTTMIMMSVIATILFRLVVRFLK